MEKFSFYEILSFLLPGFVFIGIIQLYQNYVFGRIPFFNMEGNFDENFITTILYFISGIMIHNFITFWLLKSEKFNWFRNLIMPSVQKISVQNVFIQKIIPFLNSEYIKLRKHKEIPVRENEAEYNLFDFVYYYLEVNNKISAAKYFQNLFFGFRNIFTISFLLIPVSVIIFAITLFGSYTYEQKEVAAWTIVINLAIFLILIPFTRQLRVQLVKKVLWSYYVERIHQNENKSNNNQ